MASNPKAAEPVPELGEAADRPEGPVAAAILAAGVGAFALGVLTTLAEASEQIKEFLNLYDPVGPLSGKTTGAVIIWLVAWVILHLIYRSKNYETSSKDYDFSRVAMVEHWEAGERDVHLSMRRKEWLERPQAGVPSAAARACPALAIVPEARQRSEIQTSIGPA